MPPRKSGMSIVTRVFLLIAGTLIFVASGEVYNGLRLRASRLEEVRGELVQLARVAAIDLNDTIAGTHQLFTTLALLSQEYGWDARACGIIAATVNSSFEYDHIAAADLDGRALCSSSGKAATGVLIPDRDVFDRAVATGDFAVGSYGTGLFSGNELVRVAHPIVNAKGTTIGVIYAGINVTWLNTEIDQWQLPANANLTIADRNGIIVARYPDARAVGRRLPDNLLRLLPEKAAGSIETAGVEGNMRLFGYVPPGTGLSRGLAVFVGFDKATVVAETERSIRTSLAIIFAGLFIAGIASWTYLRRVLATPLDGLLKVAALWRTGDWTARTVGVSGIPEFDRLATAFDEMAGAVVVRDGSLAYRDTILHAISRCAAELLENKNLKDAIPNVLKRFGEAVAADRIVVLQTSNVDQSKVFQYAWQGPDAPVALTSTFVTALPSATVHGLQDWSKRLREGEVIGTSYADTRGAERKLFDDLKIASNLQAPIVVDDDFWGQMMIDDCHRPRTWTPTEIEALKVLANLIGASIARHLHLEQLSSADEVVRNSPVILYRIAVASGVPLMTYISDNVAVLSHTASELVADPSLFLSMIHPDDRVTTKSVLAAIMAGGGKGAFEVRIAGAGGAYRRMENRYTPVFDENRHLTEVAGVLVDITERKEAEEALRASEAHYRELFESTRDAMLLMDPSGRCISANPSALALFGAKNEAEFLERNPWDYSPEFQPDGRPSSDKAREMIEEALNRGSTLFEWTHRRDDGTEFPADVLLTALRGDEGARIYATVRDITERKAAERKLGYANSVLTATTESSPEGMIVVDAAGKILSYNRRFLEMWRIPAALADAGIDDAVMRIGARDVKNTDEFVARVNYLYEHPEISEHENIEFKDGRVFDRHTSVLRQANGDYIGRIWFFLDITERKEAEERLQFANTILTTQSETSPDGILVVDTNRKIISFNRRFVEVMRIPKDLIPASASDPINDEPILSAVVSSIKDPESFLARVQHLYAHPDETAHEEVETTDGRLIDRHTAGMRAPDGRYLGRIWFFRDVTEARKAERELIESEIRFRTILQVTGDAILVVDLKTHRPVLGNQAASRMLGYPLEELVATHMDALFPAEIAPERAKVRARVAGGESILTPNVRLRRRDGSELTADIFASPMTLAGQTYLVAVYHDVTERNRTEIALTRERDFSTAIIDNLPGLFFVTDSAGRLIRFNASLAKNSRTPMERLHGMDILTNVVAEDHETAVSKIREAHANGHAETEIGVISNSGVVRRYLLTLGRLELADGPGLLGVGLDVTEARRVEKLLQESEQRFRAIFASVSDGILLHDFATGAIIDANQSVCDMFGYTHEEIVAHDIAALSANVTPDVERDIWQRFAAAQSGDNQVFEWQAKAKDGRPFFVEVSLRQVVFGDTRYLLSTAHDITARKRDEARILEMARNDSLTGLPNRRVFAEAVQQAIGHVHRGGKSFAVIYLDLDHFKDVNDTLGHPAGDALLKQVAERLKAAVRDTDTVARFGGDEFAVLQTDIAEPTDAGMLAAKLMQVLGEPFAIDGNEVRSGGSFGIAVHGPDATDAESLLSRADVALYRAKSEGRGTYRFFTDTMDTEVRNRVELGNDLRAAIGSEQIFLEYQPQVDVASGRIVGVEALVRWNHPRRGIVSPAEFIPAAEKNGLIVPLGHWVLRAACRQAKEWRDAGVAPNVVGINLSALQFKTPLELEEDIAAALRETGLPSSMLELEITESVLMDASLEHNDVLVRLRASGLRLAIDDFGTGYSSLDYLRRYPMDRIKIAQNFVLDLGTKSGSAAVVKATIGLAHELGIDVIAEGVETEEQLALLRQWGCREAQGFLYARALTAERLLPLLRNGKIVPTLPAIEPVSRAQRQ